ncbi:hypothetical protein BDZ45DRAFT_743444 [Acephala macrosclerotiorum]|nr:hypothetical protein BDZ45DRAFT_743444 [Acephala macrosclerotiorum]
MSSVDQVHASGIKGKGIKIAVINTGVDFRHPSLVGHGTHVIGIIGMEDQPGTGFGLLGVAPEATLGMYRIFGRARSASLDVVTNALMKAGVLWGTTQPTDYVRFDLVPANTSFVPDLYGYNTSRIAVPPPTSYTPSVLSAEGFRWESDPSFPNADYRIVMRVLRSGKVYGDPESRESWLSVVVTIDTNVEYHYTPPGTGLGNF